MVIGVVVGSAWGREGRGAIERYYFRRRSICSKPRVILPGVEVFQNGQPFLIILETLFRPRGSSITVCIAVTVSVMHSVV